MVEKILSYRDFISREKIIFKQTFSSVHSFHKVSNNLKKKLIKTERFVNLKDTLMEKQ